jgi:dTDP-4-amino-4,6-dideoxygalactose transaminase
MHDLTDKNEFAGFAEPLYVGRPNIGDRAKFLERVGDILNRRWFTNNGPLLREFEQRIADYIGVKHCVAMCNATVALEIASRALELRGEVIMPAYTFVATAHAFQWQEITPVFADINPQTYTIDCESIERVITPKTSAIVGVHLWGRACDINGIERVAKTHGLHVLYDAAHAFGCSSHGNMIGNFGECEVFSFHATKFLNSFEGGAVTTNNDLMAEKMRLMRNFGFSGFDRVIYLGVNGKMTEICAAMGLTSLEALHDIVAINRRNYEAYLGELSDLPGLSVVCYDLLEKNNYQYIAVEVDPAICGVHRDALVEALHSHNIIARKYFWPGCHRMEPYRSLQPNAALLLPQTEKMAARVLLLPTGQAVTPEDIRTVCHVIRSACRSAAKTTAKAGKHR